MFKSTLATASLLGAAAFALAAEYTTVPLAPRVGSPAGAKAFVRIDPAASGLTVPNVFADPRMWGSRFRELTLGAVETGVAVADFNGDGRPDIFAISKNGPCALYLQTGDFQFKDVARAAGGDRGRTLKQHRGHGRRHQSGRGDGHLRLPLRAAQSAFHQ